MLSSINELINTVKLMNIFVNSLEKLFFMDKVITSKLINKDFGILKLNDNFFLDIPKVGSSTIKHYIALSSFRYRTICRFSNWRPAHTIATSIQKDELRETLKPIKIILRDPLERVFSVYKQKVLNKK